MKGIKPSPLAKLTFPKVHRALMRERLFDRMDEVQQTKAGLFIVGRPGAGKTTLLASWLTSRKLPIIWYHVDAGDNDLATFFHYLRRAAMDRRSHRKGEELPAFTPEFANDVGGFTRRFFRRFFDGLPKHTILAFDNYQEVDVHSAFHQVVADAVSELPPGMMIVAVSRRDPPARYARLLANARFGLLDWDELRLSAEESHAIAQTRGNWDAARLNMLHERSDGWAAGLTLLLEQRKASSTLTTATTLTSDALFDYFASEVFDALDEPARQLLPRAALFAVVIPSLASALSGIEHAESIFEELHRRRLFVDRHTSPSSIQLAARYSCTGVACLSIGTPGPASNTGFTPFLRSSCAAASQPR